MADLLFKCPHCARHLVVEDSAVGETLECLACGQPVLVPKSANAFKCPSCAYDLSASTKVAGKFFHCPSCGRSLIVPATPTMRLPVNSFGEWLR